ncbi:hypothetical protein D3C73_845940 [compost metagenome]
MRLALEVQGLGEAEVQGRPRGAPHGGVGLRRPARQPLKQGLGFAGQKLGVDRLPGQAPIDRLVRRDAIAGHHQAHGPVPAQGARQQPAGPAVGGQPHLGEGVGQEGRARHDDHVGGQGDRRPRPDGRSVHRRDQGDRQVRQLEQQGIDVALQNGPGVVGQRLRQRPPGAEGAPRPGDHQGARARGHGRVYGGVQRLDHRLGQGVHALRLLQANDGPVALAFKTDHRTPRRAAPAAQVAARTAEKRLNMS